MGPRFAPIQGGSGDTALRWVIRDLGSVLVIELGGDVSANTADGLEVELQARGLGPIPVIVDCASVDRIDVGGVDVLVRLYARCEAANTRFAVAAPSRQVQSVLDMMGCRYLFPTFPDVAAARDAAEADRNAGPHEGREGRRSPLPRAPLGTHALAFEYAVRPDADVVAFRGEIDLDNVPMLREACLRAGSPAGVRVLIDLSDVTYIDSTGLQALIRIHRHYAERGRAVAVVSSSKLLWRFFSTLGLGRLIPIFPTVDVAIRHMTGQPL